MSHQASAWAWSVTVGDSTRKSVLAAIADHADPDGRHAWPSKETIAEKVECSVKTVRRAVAALIVDGWLREGDQLQVAHLRGDRRPVVYDLAMNETTRQAWKSATHAGDADAADPTDTGGHLDPPSDLDDRTPVTGRKTGTGGHPGPHGGTPMSPKQSLNELPPIPQTVDQPARTCARHPDSPAANCRGCGTTNRQLDAQRRRDAEVAAREAERRRLDAEREQREQARAAGRGPTAQAAIEEVRQQLAGAR